MFRAVLACLLIAAPLGLGSCGSVQAVKDSTAAVAAKVARYSKFPGFGLADLLPAQVKVVKVREQDLQDLPLGRERSLAFANQRKLGFWAGGGPVDFKQPDLPEPGAEIDGSLLPPKNQ
jgi:hypothetical protein